MKIVQRMILTWVVVMATTFATMPNAHANDPAAVVIIATGDFYAVNTQLKKRTLKRRSKVYVGEKLVTGKNARAQVRFIDGAVLSLRPETELKVHKYSYGKSTADEGSWMTLLKGGFRTITGAIGKKKYKVTTSMATIGIRGTHYEAVIHDEQLFVALWDGGVTVSNSAGKVDLGLGADYNFGMVQSDTVEPQGQIDPPAAIVNDTQPTIAPDLSKTSNESNTVNEPVLIEDVALADISTIMPTSGTATYGVISSGGTHAQGSVSATGSTDSISAFSFNATANFADASLTGSLTATTISGAGTNNWEFTSLTGQIDGSGYSMTGGGFMNGADTASATIDGSFTGANAETMMGDIVVSSGTVTETATFTATK